MGGPGRLEVEFAADAAAASLADIALAKEKGSPLSNKARDITETKASNSSSFVEVGGGEGITTLSPPDTLADCLLLLLLLLLISTFSWGAIEGVSVGAAVGTAAVALVGGLIKEMGCWGMEA
jgi:hypothetical protein